MAFEKIVFLILPPITLMKVNRKVEKRINSIWATIDSRNYYSNLYPNVKEDNLLQLYHNGIEIKDKLEDKGKSTLFTMSLVITLFSGFITLTYNSNFKFYNSYMQIAMYLVLGLILCYMLISAFTTLRMLSEKNKIYMINVDYYNMKDNYDRIDQLGANIESNNLLNVIRNNFISTSFQCLINSIVLIIVFISLVFLNSQIIKSQNNSPDFKEQYQVQLIENSIVK